MFATQPRCVVIGASGILAPLGAMLAALGAQPVGISRGRRPAEGTWHEQVALDTSDRDAVRVWVRAAEPASLIVAYAPAVADDVWPLLPHLSEHLLVVATTAWSAPDSPSPPWAGLARQVIHLGWVPSLAGARWHTPHEVSAAVTDALVRGVHRLDVGVSRPWADRPAA